MSRELIGIEKNEGFTLNAFHGGAERGPCFQITLQNPNGSIGQGTWIQLTEQQMRTLLLAFCAERMGIA